MSFNSELLKNTEKNIKNDNINVKNSDIINLENIFYEFKKIEKLNLDEKIDIINKIRKEIHKYSPFKDEPVDCVQWIKNDKVKSNDYNPNSVAPTEMELLHTSIKNDGYTQPIVSWNVENGYEVIDGFHRNRVGKEYEDIKERIHGYLPLVIINENKQDRNERIASTIRHNRARGKHKIESMSDIVIELKRRNWSDKKISKELGMDEDEILRLTQITGLTDIFDDDIFSKSWDIGIFDENIDLNDLEDNDDNLEDNNDETDRIYHSYDKWECIKYGFYENKPENMTKEEGEKIYYEFLSNLDEFEDALGHVISEWKYSCEHNLSNKNMNRIAWLGQASVCYARKIPSSCRAGFNLLNEEQQFKANELALQYLNIWLKENERDEIDIVNAGIMNTVNKY